MAKELPFFKFEPNQWENGNIQICNRHDKGLFIDLCSMYWSRVGNLPFKLAVQKLCGGDATAFDSLIDEEIFALEDDMVKIYFLDEQLLECKKTSNQNSENAKKRWEKERKTKESKVKKKDNTTASKSQSENNTIRKDKIREDNNITEPDKSDSGSKEKSLQTVLKEKFEDYYKSNKTEPYYYQAKDASQLKNIISKIKLILKEKKGQKHKINDSEIIEVWEYILQKIKITDNWVYDNLSIPTINTKFNELISKIRNNGQNTTNRQNNSTGGKRTPEHQEPKKSFSTPNN